MLAPVVVGVDGSSTALDAVAFAAAEAFLRRRPLHIVHASPTPRVAGSEATFRAHAAAVTADARVRAEKAAPGLDLVTDIVTGPPAPVLLDRGRSAFLLVVGRRGLGGFAGLLTGSVAMHLAAHGSCPIVVTRGERRITEPVVVGVDGSGTARRAVEFAAEEARMRGAELVVMHAWRTPVTYAGGTMMPVVYDPALLEAEEDGILTAAVAGLGDRFPGLAVRRVLVRGPAARLLTDLSRHAQLVVTGDRGHGAFTGLLLGSVSHHLIAHADCPVIVVRNS